MAAVVGVSAEASGGASAAAPATGLGANLAEPAANRETLRLPRAQPALWPRSLWLDLDSRHTGQRYRVLIGWPVQPPPPSGYPVLWALDGLASFPLLALERRRTPTTQDNRFLQRREQGAPDGLVLGIGYASGEPFDLHARALDYTPAGDGSTGDLLSPRHGGAEAFTRFLVDELRPLLAQAWPLDARRHSLFGFSYGGLYTVQLLSREPQHFSRWWAASPSLWFRGHQAMHSWADGRPPPDYRQHPVQLRVTVGLDEQYRGHFDGDDQRQRLQDRRMVDNAQALVRQLAAQPGLTARLDVVPGRDHLDMLAHGARQVFRFAFDAT